jgi:hypothetical protein
MADACYWLYNKPGGTRTQNWWEDNLPGYVFLPRAFLQIAEAEFGAEWTGEELNSLASLDRLAWAEQSLPLSDSEGWPSDKVDLAKRLLRRASDDYAAPQELSNRDKAKARKLLKETQESEARFDRIKALMIEALREGRLIAGLKPYNSATTMKECLREEWRPNVLDQRVRFYYCRLNPDGPEVGRVTDGAPYCWIYITEDSLTRYLVKGTTRTRGTRQRKGAKDILISLYPKGIPSAKSHGELCTEVFAVQKRDGLTPCSERTIRRAREEIDACE